MQAELKTFEKSIKKIHRFGWEPKYEESFLTDLPITVVPTIVVQTIEKLSWDATYVGASEVIAKRKHWNAYTNRIAISFLQGKIMVESTLLGNGFMDFGQNSKRVKLFIHAFKLTAAEYDKEAIAALEMETEKEQNLENYVLPDSLPKPKESGRPKIAIPIVGGILTALLLGFVVAFITLKLSYYYFLFEIVVGACIGFAFQKFIKHGNYTHYQRLSYMVAGTAVLTYLSNEYFYFLLFAAEHITEPVSFVDFMTYKFEAGLNLDGMKLGWIGLVVSWVFQIGFAGFIAMAFLQSSIVNHQLDRVPMEVIDFANYHFSMGKTEVEVRSELAAKGWTKREDQDEVFVGIGAVYAALEMQRTA